MSKKLPTVREAEPHTIAKITILRQYLHAWFRILGKTIRNQTILYVDGFAGPGSYTNHDEGSPLAALHAAQSAIQDLGTSFVAKDFHCAFIEKDQKRYEVLCSSLAHEPNNSRLSITHFPGEFESGIKSVQERIPGPFYGQDALFVFADPFGGTGIPFNTFAHCMAGQAAELLINLDADGIGRIFQANNNNRESQLNQLFGDDSWRAVLNQAAPLPELSLAILNLYKRRLRTFLNLIMRGNSHIEWTESTWNPVTGCSKVSAGCKNCYAERMAKRLQAMGSPRYENGFAVTLHHDLVDAPKAWKAPRVIFVNSMSDLFHPKVPFEFIARVFATMEACPQHTFQILTKRSERLKEVAARLSWPINVWMGVSVEDHQVLTRIDDLRKVPAAVRFLSCEPLIGPVDGLNLEEIDWVIVGGESGPGARPMKVEWVRTIFRACRKHNTAFFFKQWGGVQKHRTGRELRGKTYDEMPVGKLRDQSLRAVA